MKKICVFGLGFVGLPLALSYSMRGCTVIGVDTNEKLIADINHGRTSHLEHYGDKSISSILNEELSVGRFQAVTDGRTALAECSNIIVTVGVPISEGEPDMSAILEVARTITRGLKKGDLVLIKSTLVPGTTNSTIRPILDESGLVAGKDFFLGYSSERIAEGKAFQEIAGVPTLVAGTDRESIERAIELTSIVSEAIIIVGSSIEVVETAKVMENISRDVNIAMAQEFARVARSINLDVFEIIRLANTHPRVKLLEPGPGVGGYCLPNALYYLLPIAKELGLNLQLLSTARRINDNVPAHVAELALQQLTIPRDKACLAVIGLAMKDYSNDDRLSPSLSVIKHLEQAGSCIKAYDPAIVSNYPFKVDTLDDALRDAQGVLILARQKGINYHDLAYWAGLLKGDPPFVLDTRNVCDAGQARNCGIKLITL
ncbi:MAG: nucleotide sugar dehydrogenase [Acidobacteriota bacterium]